jgi:hypothetical protein
LFLEACFLLLLKLLFSLLQLFLVPYSVIIWVKLQLLLERGFFKLWVHPGQELFGGLPIRIIMVVNDVSDLRPLCEDLLTQLLLASLAEILNLSLFRIANVTKVVEKYIYFEVVRQDLSFVLPNVLRTQLHLSCFDVVSLLNKASVEHDSTEGV